MTKREHIAMATTSEESASQVCFRGAPHLHSPCPVGLRQTGIRLPSCPVIDSGVYAIQGFIEESTHAPCSNRPPSFSAAALTRPLFFRHPFSCPYFMLPRAHRPFAAGAT